MHRLCCRPEPKTDTGSPELAVAAGASAEDLYLKLLWSVGPRLAGIRLRSTLWWVERDRAVECGGCGQRHAQPPQASPTARW